MAPPSTTEPPPGARRAPQAAARSGADRRSRGNTAASAAGTDDLRSRFHAEVVERGTFSRDWFTGTIDSWEPMMETLAGRGARALEIGSFEGLSACYVLWRLPDSHVTCVDTFAGSEEHVAGLHLPARASRLHSTRTSPWWTPPACASSSETPSTSSPTCTPMAHVSSSVYVDGSHRALDVLVDAALSWRVLVVDGFLVFDDYRWSELGEDPLLRPGDAIDCFLRLVEGKYELLASGSQLALRKAAA